MNRRRLAAILVVLLGACGSVHAAQQSVATDYDCRLRRVVYNPADVVELQATVGIATHLILDPDETYVTHAFGDQDAWTFRHKDNHYFFKPKQEQGDTNLTIVTDKRSYNFYIHYVSDRSQGCSQVFQVAFGYPDKDKARRVADDGKAKAKADKTAMAAEFKKAPDNANLNYTMSATPRDQALVPLNVWDDGRFTHFKFPANVELPLVYVRNADGSENVVNTKVEGAANNIIVAAIVAKRFALRLGDNVVGIYNDSFSGGSMPGTTGTASDKVERVVKGARDDD